MHQLYLESTLDRLLRTEEGLVRQHVLKVLWVLRDHDQAVESAQAAVAELHKMKVIVDRYKLSGADPLQARADASSKLALRLRKSITERNLPAKLHASLQWCSKSGLMPGLGCASICVCREQEDECKEALHKARVENNGLEDQTNSYKAEIKELRSTVMTAEAALVNQIAMASSAISVEKLMDNLQMITLNLDRDFDAWKPEDARSLADTVAESAGVAKEHVKILDFQRGSVIASTVIMAPDWAAVAAKIQTSLMDDSGSLKDMGVVGCVGLMGGVVGKPPRYVAAPVVPVGRRVKLGASAPSGLVKNDRRFVERVVAKWTRRDVSAALNAWRASVSNHRRISMLVARIVGQARGESICQRVLRLWTPWKILCLCGLF